MSNLRKKSNQSEKGMASMAGRNVIDYCRLSIDYWKSMGWQTSDVEQNGDLNIQHETICDQGEKNHLIS